jgi:hypothetical protein
VKRKALQLAAIANCAAVLALSVNGGARAQMLDAGTTFNPNNTQANTFDRGENVSVRQRPRPDYQAEGLHLGGFMIYPKLTAAFAYDDNIFATHTGRVGDEIFTLAPEIDVQSTWSRNALAAYVRDNQSWFVTHSSENANQYGAGGSGKLEFGQSVFTAAVDYGRYALPRSAANSGAVFSKHPIQFDSTAVNGQLAHTFNRLRLSARVDYQIYDYFNGQTPTGVLVFERNLNHEVATYTGKAEYALSPNTAVFLTGAYNNRTYDLGPSDPHVFYNSNSDGYNIAGGINFDITHLMRGEVQLGWLDQRFKSPLFRPISGLSAKGQVEWFPTQLTTVTATALRAVGDSGIIGAAGFVNTTGGLQIDHELLRNLILTGTASYTNDKYNGIGRNDNIWGVGASANWLLNRRVGLTLAYQYANQQSSGALRGPQFSDNRVTLSTVLQF